MKLKEILIIGALGLAGCSSNNNAVSLPKNKSSLDSLKDSIQTERAVYKEFIKIGKDYREYLHDCDDMSQEFRDVLVNNDYKEKDIRLAYAKDKKDNEGHMWVEMKSADVWLAYDPTIALYAADPKKILKQYRVEKYFPGNYVYREPIIKGLPFKSPRAGYSFRNDRFIDGKWVRNGK